MSWTGTQLSLSVPNTVTKEAERFAKQVESTSALLARLSIYLQRTQGYHLATILNREKERAALLAGLPPSPMPECMVDETLAESNRVVPMMARLRLRELPLTKGLLFAGQWTPTVESTTKTQLLSVSQAQLAHDQPSTSGDRFRIPFRKGRGSGGKKAKKGKKGGGLNQSSSSSEGGGGGRGADRGRGRGRGRRRNKTSFKDLTVSAILKYKMAASEMKSNYRKHCISNVEEDLRYINSILHDH